MNPDAYDPNKSHSSKKTSDRFQASYGDGTATSGPIFTDSLSVSNLKADNIPIGRSTTKFVGDEGPNKGISGLSFPSLATFPKKYKPWFFALKEQKKIKEAVFQFTLKSGEGSSLHIGGVDSSKYKGEVSWARVDGSKGFWATSAKVNGRDISAIVDSGTTVIIGPTSQVRSIANSIHGLVPFNQQGQQFYAFDCNSSPNVTITIGGRDFKLSKENVKYGKTSDGKCVLSIMGVDQMPLNSWILGDSFFKEVSIIFDAEKNRMGFAKQA